MTELARFCGVGLDFGGVRALDAVHVTIGRGMIHALIGPNGAGKTSLFNLLSGLYQPTRGEIYFMGKPLTGYSPHQIAQLGIARTFQNIRLFDEMTLSENVVVGMHRHLHYGLWATLTRNRQFRAGEAEATTRARSLLEQVGLGHKAEQLAATLSYGEQRKLEIARALAQSPRMLLLDEPVAGMNPSEKREIGKLIQSLRTQHLTLLLIEHDMRFIMELCDEVTVLNFGRVIAQGDPATIQRHPEVLSAYLGRDQDGTANS